MVDVIPLPSKLERLSKRIKKNMQIGHEIRAQWIESKIEMACDLLEARLEFRDNNNAFHDWLTTEGLGDNALPKNDRSALLAMAVDPERMRAVLTATSRWSPRYIYEMEWGSSLHRENPPQKPKRGPSPSPKRETARTIARKRIEDNEPITRKEGADGIGETILRFGAEFEQGRQDGLAEAEARGATYTKAQNHHIDMMVKTYMRELNVKFKQRIEELETEFDARVQKRFEEAKAAAWPLFEKETEEARLDKEYYRKMINGHKPPFTMKEYSDIVLAVHPDNSASKETRARALQSVTDKKLQLTGKL